MHVTMKDTIRSDCSRRIRRYKTPSDVACVTGSGIIHPVNQQQKMPFERKTVLM